jgi:aryl-alcohol dehydrogenase-like predicted oxidoreductase
VRRALSDPTCLGEVLADLGRRGLVPQQTAATLDSLVRDGGATSLQDAAYRFCRYEPGIDVVLSGTGKRAHLESNAASLARPPLPPGEAARLRELFAKVDDVSGN